MTAPIEMGKFIGAPTRAHTFEGVVIAENTYASGMTVAAHEHDSPLLSLVLHGHATEEVNGQSREMATHNLLYTPSSVSYTHLTLPTTPYV